MEFYRSPPTWDGVVGHPQFPAETGSGRLRMVNAQEVQAPSRPLSAGTEATGPSSLTVRSPHKVRQSGELFVGVDLAVRIKTVVGKKRSLQISVND